MNLHIPIIDDYMKAQSRYNEFFGNHWESYRDQPRDTIPLHIWKYVTPLTDSKGLSAEKDAYRKKYNDTLTFQLNIYSTVQGDTIAARHGKLFFLNKHNLLDIGINDLQIDSIAKSWGLIYLIRGAKNASIQPILRV